MVNETLHITCPIQTKGNYARRGTPSQDATRLPAPVPSMPGTSLNIVHSTFSNMTPTTQSMTGLKIDASEELQLLRVGRGALLCNAITSKADLEEAVDAWVYDEDATRAECGDINDWDISVSTEN